MKKFAIRLAGLVLILVLAISVARIPDQQLALAANMEEYPSTVIVTTDNGRTKLSTDQPTLAEALNEAGFSLGDFERLSLPGDTALEPGQTYDVTLTRLGAQNALLGEFAPDTLVELESMDELLSRSGEKTPDASEGTSPTVGDESNVDETTQATAAEAVTALEPDREFLRVVSLENCDYPSYENYLSVASVIMNRVDSPDFPNTIEGVISQKGQFTVWSAKNYKHIDDNVYQACYDAINGKRNLPSNVMYFAMSEFSWAETYAYYGGHYWQYVER